MVVALKDGSLPGALESIKTAVGSNTVVMSVMNGVDSEELIAAQVGAEQMCIRDRCKACDVKYYLLGNGSNILFEDAGYRGVVVEDVYKRQA